MKSTKQNKLTSTDNQIESVRVEFPSARYFQIHFEHIHAELLETKREMAELQRQMAELRSHLGHKIRMYSAPEQAVDPLKSIARNEIGENFFGNE